MTHEPSRLTVHMAALIDRVAVLASDREKDVRYVSLNTIVAAEQGRLHFYVWTIESLTL